MLQRTVLIARAALSNMNVQDLAIEEGSKISASRKRNGLLARSASVSSGVWSPGVGKSMPGNSRTAMTIRRPTANLRDMKSCQAAVKIPCIGDHYTPSDFRKDWTIVKINFA